MDTVVVDRRCAGRQRRHHRAHRQLPRLPRGHRRRRARRAASSPRPSGSAWSCCAAVERRFGRASTATTSRVELATGQQLCAHAALLVTGSSYKRLNVPGEDELIGSRRPLLRDVRRPALQRCVRARRRRRRQLRARGRAVAVALRGQGAACWCAAPSSRRRRCCRTASATTPSSTCAPTSRCRSYAATATLDDLVVRDTVDGRGVDAAPIRAVRVHRPGAEHEVPRRASSISTSGVSWSPTSATGRRWRACTPPGDCRSGSTKQLPAASGEAVAAVLSIRAFLQEHSHLPRVDVNDVGATVPRQPAGGSLVAALDPLPRRPAVARPAARSTPPALPPVAEPRPHQRPDRRQEQQQPERVARRTPARAAGDRRSRSSGPSTSEAPGTRPAWSSACTRRSEADALTLHEPRAEDRHDQEQPDRVEDADPGRDLDDDRELDECADDEDREDQGHRRRWYRRPGRPRAPGVRPPARAAARRSRAARRPRPAPSSAGGRRSCRARARACAGGSRSARRSRGGRS